MYTLSPEQEQIHNRAKLLAVRHRFIEAELVDVLQTVDCLKIYKAFGKSSLFTYANEILGLEKNIAYTLITVSRKAREIPELKSAIKSKHLTVSKASRIFSNLNSENAHELIEFAATHTKEETDFEMARLSPKCAARDAMRPLSEEFVEVKITMRKATFEKLKRAESLQAQKNLSTKWGDVIESTLESHLDKYDPVRHPVSRGGTNDPENLTTLCGFHHDLAHQLSLPIDGQITWLRSPSAKYSVTPGIAM
jgi:hypothetical protein